MFIQVTFFSLRVKQYLVFSLIKLLFITILFGLLSSNNFRKKKEAYHFLENIQTSR